MEPTPEPEVVNDSAATPTPPCPVKGGGFGGPAPEQEAPAES